MTPLDALTAARALIAPGPECWTQDSWARNAMGEEVPPASLDACRWCGRGALKTITQNRGDDRDMLDGCVPGGDFINWQDEPTRTHAEVLSAFDRAIERAKATPC